MKTATRMSVVRLHRWAFACLNKWRNNIWLFLACVGFFLMNYHCFQTHQKIWEQELYLQFQYHTPRDFFHTFEADVSIVFHEKWSRHVIMKIWPIQSWFWRMKVNFTKKCDPVIQRFRYKQGPSVVQFDNFVHIRTCMKIAK